MAKKKTPKKRVARKSVKRKAVRKATKATARRTSSGASKKGTKRSAPTAKAATAKDTGTKVAKKAVAKKTVARKKADAGASSRTKPESAQAAAEKAIEPAKTASQKKNSTGVDTTTATRTDAERTSLMAQGASVIRIRSNANANANAKRRGAADASSNHKAKGASATAHDPIQFPEESRKLPRTPLKAKELREFRALLYLKRAELCGDVERLTDEAFHTDREGGGTERSNMPIHMADLGSDNWEQDFTLGLIDTERHLVAEIDAALARIDNKTYGICLATHNPISVARLRAKPWAKYCIEYARAREEGRA